MGMTLKDSLYPENLRLECMTYIEQMKAVNNAITITRRDIDAFVTDDSLSGIAYKGIKSHLSDYTSFLKALKLANDFDISEMQYMCNNCGDENLEGMIILPMIKVSQEMYAKSKKAADNMEALAKSSSITRIQAVANKLYTYYRTLQEDYQNTLDTQLAKKEFFEEFEEKTRSFFESSYPYRTLLNYAVNNMKKAYDFQNKSFVSSSHLWNDYLDKLTYDDLIFEVQEEMLKAGLLNLDYEHMTVEEQAKYIKQMGDIVSKHYINYSGKINFEYRITPTLIFYYSEKGESNPDYPFSLNTVFNEERDILASLKIKGEKDGLHFSLESDGKNNSAAVGDEVHELKLTYFDGLKYSTKTEDGYTIALSLSAKIESIGTELSIKKETTKGSAEIAYGIKIAPYCGYKNVPTLPAEDEIHIKDLFNSEFEMPTIPIPDISEVGPILTAAGVAALTYFAVTHPELIPLFLLTGELL